MPQLPDDDRPMTVEEKIMGWSFDDLNRAAEDEALFEKLLEDFEATWKDVERLAEGAAFTAEQCRSLVCQYVYEWQNDLLGIEFPILVIPYDRFPP